MSQPPTQNPVYRSLNKPLKIWGVDRRLFFLALITGAGTFNFFGSLLGGLLMFAGLYLLLRLATASDPELPRIVMISAKFKALYDPAKHEMFDIRRITRNAQTSQIS